MSVNVPVKIGYDVDPTTAERIALEVARGVQKDVEGATSVFEPSVRFQTLTDQSIELSVALSVRDFEAQYRVRHEFVKRLRVRYLEAGIGAPIHKEAMLFREQESTPDKLKKG
jgi:small-conductance mechanosensitive channel